MTTGSMCHLGLDDSLEWIVVFSFLLLLIAEPQFFGYVSVLSVLDGVDH